MQHGISQIPKNTRIITKNDDPAIATLLPIAHLYASAALSIGHPVALLSEVGNSTVFIRHKTKKDHWELICNANLSINGAANMLLTNYKQAINALFLKAGLPSNRGIVIKKNEWGGSVRAFSLPSFPVVAKPNSGSVAGSGVTTNINDTTTLDRVVTGIFKEYSSVVIEEFISVKNEYRVLVLDGKIIGIVQRIPAYVTGDGTHTIRELIHEKNRLRKKMHIKPITFDSELKNTLKSKKLDLTTIPKNNNHIQLKRACNFSIGGELRTCTDTPHKDIATTVKKIAELTGIRLMGVDVITNDITKSISAGKARIIEINPNPDITIHGHFDSKSALMIAQKIVRALFL